MTIVVPGKGTADCTRRRRELVFGFLAGELERQRAPSIPIMPRTLRAFCLPLVALLLAAGVASAQSAADTTAIVQALAKAIALELRTPRDPGANSLDEDGPRFEISEANDELTVFLGPDLDFVDEIDAFVTKHFDFFFEHWLSGWSTDPAQWPQRRTRRMFREWFDVRIHTMVEDVVDAPYELE